MVRQIPFMLVLFTMVFAVYMSRSPRPKQAIKILYFTMLIVAFLWVMGCLRIYPQYVFPDK